MKRLIFLIGILVFTLKAFAVDSPIDLTKNPPPHPGPNSVTTVLPVTATISETQLAVYFDFPVGVATIMVSDASNLIIYLESVDTDTTTEVFIPVGMWEGGNYTLSVSYYSTTQRGDFNIQ